MASRAPGALILCCLLAGALGAAAAPASAEIGEARALDGPSPDVLELGGVAMAEDGSGGVTWLRRIGGRAHVFAARVQDGALEPAQRVDIGQNFDSSWPRVGAAPDGRLLVTWVQEFGGSDRMFSAQLDRGATRFQAPVPVDIDIGDSASTYPSLALSRSGFGYLAYRVVTDTSTANPPGYVGADVRVARYGGAGLWSVLGGLADRTPTIPVRAPNATNGPKVSIDSSGGSGVVAFNEPGDDFVDRIWARRIFGSTFGIPLQVSPSTFGGQPLTGPADAFDLDGTDFAGAGVAFRQQPGTNSALGGTRVFVNQIAEVPVDGASAFRGARPADGGARAAPGAPTVSITGKTTFLTGFGAGNSVLLGEGDEAADEPTARVDDGSSSVPGDPAVEFAESGAAALAFKSRAGVRNTVQVRERPADGVPGEAALAGPRGGPVGRLEMAGSGLGDALVAWDQGGGEFLQIVLAVVDAPPGRFVSTVPNRWVRRARVAISWSRAAEALGPVEYTVAADDEELRSGLKGLLTRLGPKALPDGKYGVEVIATDSLGQTTTTNRRRLRVDRARPRLRLRVRGRRVRVRISDRTSGLVKRSVRIAFGDGAKRAKKASAAHAFARRGRFRVTVRARDKAGNKLTLKRRVRIR